MLTLRLSTSVTTFVPDTTCKCTLSYQESLTFKSWCARFCAPPNHTTAQRTLPKTTCTPLRCGAGADVMKNWLPFVSLPWKRNIYNILSESCTQSTCWPC